MRKATIPYYIILIFACIGVGYLCSIVHELSHRQDYKDIALESDICLLNMDFKANHHFTYNKEDTAAVKEIKKYTEIKAYLTSVIITAFFIMVLVIERRMK